MSTVERDNAGSTVPRLPEGVVPQQPQAEPVAAPDAASKKDDGRDYVVLKRNPGDSPGSPQTWEFVANISASSAEQAVRRAAEQPGTSFLNADGPTTLVAVPARSFNPVSLTVKVETSIVLS